MIGREELKDKLLDLIIRSYDEFIDTNDTDDQFACGVAYGMYEAVKEIKALIDESEEPNGI